MTEAAYKASTGTFERGTKLEDNTKKRDVGKTLTRIIIAVIVIAIFVGLLVPCLFFLPVFFPSAH